MRYLVRSHAGRRAFGDSWQLGDVRMKMVCDSKSSKALTLIELLVVVAIVSILATIAIPNIYQAQERALMASDASNLHTIATALQNYYVDYGTLPPADRDAGPFMSHTMDYVSVGNGPAAGGSWDGLPWLLFENNYISNWETMFCPKYLRLYQGGETIRDGYPRYHNFRYAYNSSALSSGGHVGGSGIMTGTVWMVRDLYLPPRSGWYGQYYPDYPADCGYPWGESDWNDKLELVVYSDMAVKTMIGGTDTRP